MRVHNRYPETWHIGTWHIYIGCCPGAVNEKHLFSSAVNEFYPKKNNKRTHHQKTCGINASGGLSRYLEGTWKTAKSFTRCLVWLCKYQTGQWNRPIRVQHGHFSLCSRGRGMWLTQVGDGVLEIARFRSEWQLLRLLFGRERILSEEKRCFSFTAPGQKPI